MEIGNLLTRDEDTQIISPYNDLNRQINAFLRKGEEQLNEGDKIMTIRNTKSYCNGDIGTVVSANSKGVTIEIEGKRIVVKNSHRKDITLAYAITVHKMQGSEAKRVMVFLPENDSMVDKRLLYTAVTRAERRTGSLLLHKSNGRMKGKGRFTYGKKLYDLGIFRCNGQEPALRFCKHGRRLKDLSFSGQ